MVPTLKGIKIMNTILVQHLDKNNKPVGFPFTANLSKYKSVNKCLNWDQIITNFVNGESYTTVNTPYGNIKFSLVE
jgi:hypothetical protein